MTKREVTFNSARRRALKLFGLGAAGAAIGTVVGSDTIFAKQFVEDGPTVRLPEMVYDPHLQMMIDPITKRPIYEDGTKLDVASGLPTVTSGCGNCPKKDDTGS